MSKEVLFSIIYCVVTVAAFCAGKYIFPKIPANVKDKLTDLAEWAAQFVVWAREFLKMKSGEEKMAAVVEQLKAIADEAGIEVTEDQLKAIAQTAYEAMKAGEAQPAQLLEAVAQPAVVIHTAAAAVTTEAEQNGAEDTENKTENKDTDKG